MARPPSVIDAEWVLRRAQRIVEIGMGERAVTVSHVVRRRDHATGRKLTEADVEAGQQASGEPDLKAVEVEVRVINLPAAIMGLKLIANLQGMETRPRAVEEDLDERLRRLREEHAEMRRTLPSSAH